MLLLQHFTGTLDNWDPVLTDALAGERELVLFDNAGVGRSSSAVPTTVGGMAKHAATFLDGLGVETCDVLGFSLGGMVAQQMVLDRPAIFRRLILVGTAPRGGEDIMHLEKPRLAKHLHDPSNKGYSVLQKIFFTLTPSGQSDAAQKTCGRRVTSVSLDVSMPSLKVTVRWSRAANPRAHSDPEVGPRGG